VISARLAPGSPEDEARPAAEPAPPALQPADANTSPEREPPREPAPPRADAATAAPRAASPLPGIEVPLIRDPTYYPARLLDVYPSPLVEIRFVYPPTADADRVSGVVRLQLLIDEFGLVNELTVVEAVPPGYFEDAAREGLRQVRFTPGVREGRAVKSRVIIQVKFEYGTEGAVAR
jgi:protein TonB